MPANNSWWNRHKKFDLLYLFCSVQGDKNVSEKCLVLFESTRLREKILSTCLNTTLKQKVKPTLWYFQKLLTLNMFSWRICCFLKGRYWYLCILESKKDTEKKVKKQIMILKTLDPCLLDMELEKYIEINNLNINPISLFQEI